MGKSITDLSSVTTVGLDLAKHVFQVHGIDADGQLVFRRQLKHRYVLAFFAKLPPCLIGIEACASSHHNDPSCCQKSHNSVFSAAVKPRRNSRFESIS